MASLNGRLPQSALAPIYSQDGKTIVGWLRKDAAAAWNAMCDEARRRGLPVPLPDGSESTYRTVAMQQHERDIWCAQGKCGNAAVPGTSNHGWGIAVDCSHNAPSANRWVVDKIGAKYGWGSKGSDAPWEEWHMKWQPVPVWWPVYLFLPLHIGVAGKAKPSRGVPVFGLSQRLKTCGYLKNRTSTYTYDVQKAVKAFQAHHHLTVDGIVGAVTWIAVKDAATACAKSGKPEVKTPVA